MSKSMSTHGNNRRGTHQTRTTNKTNLVGQRQKSTASDATFLQKGRSANTTDLVTRTRRRHPRPAIERESTLNPGLSPIEFGKPIPMTLNDMMDELRAGGAETFIDELWETSEITNWEDLIAHLIQEAKGREGVHISQENGVLHISIQTHNEIQIRDLLRPKVITTLVTLATVIGFGLVDLAQQPGHVLEIVRTLTAHWP